MDEIIARQKQREATAITAHLASLGAAISECTAHPERSTDPRDHSSSAYLFLGEHDDDGVYTYMAFNDAIADYAITHQRFGGPHWGADRMSWVKPSFAWVLYRSGYAAKDKNQARVLKIKSSHDAFAELLASCVHVVGGCPRDTMGRVQWDPARDLYAAELDRKRGLTPRKLPTRRAIQIGFKSTLKHQYIESITEIVDVTDLAKRVGAAHAVLLETGDGSAMAALVPELPHERPYLPHCSDDAVLANCRMIPINPRMFGELPAHSAAASPKAIYLCCGPSGAGKDTTLLGTRKQLLAEGSDPSDVVFVSRHITRDAALCTDIETSLTEEEFKARSAAGEYAYEWAAHATRYAIPSAAIAAGAGKRLVLNTSRTIIDAVRADYEPRGTEVYALNITARPATLRIRLTRRGRESAEAIEERIARALELEPKGEHVIRIVNEASRADGVERVREALIGQQTFSLWLSPSSATRARFAALSARIVSESGSGVEALPAPHITLARSFTASHRDAVRLAKRIAPLIEAVAATPTGTLSTSVAERYRALVVEIERDAALLRSSAAAGAILTELALDADAVERWGTVALERYAPHLSLLYGEHDAEALAAAERSVLDSVDDAELLTRAFALDELVLASTCGSEYKCWSEVARFAIGGGGGGGGVAEP